jgi:hypothetical protein
LAQPILPATPGEGNPAAWADWADELAEWAWDRLVNRVDRWGRYGDGGTWTAPGLSQRGRVLLTLADLVRHFRAAGRDDVLGLHSTSPDNSCLWVALDIDKHADDGGNDASANLAAALAWHARAKSLGFRPLLYGSNGKGGYHLRILFREAIPAPRAFTFARWLAADHARHGLPAMPERFPKQPDVRRCGKGLGNWLRTPGRHYKRDYWSEFWDGYRWLSGDDAARWLLSFTGDSPNLIPRLADPVQPAYRPFNPALASRHDLATRITRYVAKVPNLGTGQGRDDNGYRLACWLRRDMQLCDDEARPWLEMWDGGNSPPKGDKEISKWLANAMHYGQRPVGCGLPAGGN